MPDEADLLKATLAERRRIDERPGRLSLWVTGLLLAAAVVWFTGAVAFDRAGIDGERADSWNTIWGLAGISFLFAFIPLPGITSALLLTLRDNLLLGVLGVLGAAIGGTAAASLLLALGHTGREHLRRRALHSARARKMLAWSKRMAKKWTYGGVFILLIPQFIPRAVVLYAAALAHLRVAPFLVVVFLGTFVRNLIMLLGFRLIP